VNTILSGLLLAILMVHTAEAGNPAADTVAARIARVAQRDSITVLVTDSGLGGLAVCADLDARVRAAGIYAKVRIIFANALPESNRGYNRMKSTQQKVRVFNDALHGMARLYAPDVILVACNTLSVLIPQTEFASSSPIPVLGIVGTGVDMLYERLAAEPGATAIIFGTETTIGAGTHRRLLIERGIDTARIVTQACPNLAGAIETNAAGDGVAAAIRGFAAQASSSLKAKGGRILAGMCCTHYGYAADRFRTALSDAGAGSVEIIDPNTRMNDVLFPQGRQHAAGRSVCTVEVVSRAVISTEEQASIGGLVEGVSPATAAALRAYVLNKELFPFDPDATE
jgi:glutamate racemase